MANVATGFEGLENFVNTVGVESVHHKFPQGIEVGNVLALRGRFMFVRASMPVLLFLGFFCITELFVRLGDRFVDASLSLRALDSSDGFGPAHFPFVVFSNAAGHWKNLSVTHFAKIDSKYNEAEHELLRMFMTFSANARFS